METTAGSTSSGTSMARSRSPRSSPIPYRVPPFEYTPAVNCYCGQKTPKWISWSDRNPGRRYRSCYRNQAGGCSLWVWLDPEPTDWQRQVLVDLRDAVKSLRTTNRVLQMEKNELEAEKHELEVLLQEAQVKHAESVEKELEARALVKELEARALVKEKDSKHIQSTMTRCCGWQFRWPC